MTTTRLSSVRAERTRDGATAFIDYYTKSIYAQRRAAGNPPKYDFVTGNPFEMPLPALVNALTKALQPKDKGWYGYAMNETASREVVAASLTKRYGAPFQPDDILMTNGAFSAMEVALKLVADAGDQVVVMTPWFFLYPTVFEAANIDAVKVPLGPQFALDIPAIRKAIGPNTRAVFLNSPHNPSGRIFRKEEIAALAEVLTEASRAQGRPVYLISDEAFSRLVYDGAKYETPTLSYPHSIMLYTYGKTLMIPGERLGYLALPPNMAEAQRKFLRDPLLHLAVGSGFCFPNATLQRAISELDLLSIDVSYLQGNRDVFREALPKAGYEVVVPEGTFFMLVRSPIPDDVKYAEILTQHDIFVLPGTISQAPGYLRVALTATRETCTGSIPGWTSAIKSLPGR